ncbi:MAG: methionine--tRNA ligase [Proteobacteria bacterium]|nr:methionine--tRNA ligase [Pseudomonadota bacterium]
MQHFISTTIPYVNGEPHIGHAQEFVLADVLTRHYPDVYFLSGADENSLKNVLAAEAAGMPTREYVARQSDAFEALTGLLGLELSDFIRTSDDPRHQPVVEAIWRACVERGDIYQADYTGLYCVGCEQFYVAAELTDGKCPEHGTVPETVAESNYFFRLTRYRDQLIELVSTGEIAIEPASRRNEVLGYLRLLDQDLSVSRSAIRSRGWGIPVPDDPGQVIYVWIDALANYISAPGFERWHGFDDVTHVVGKGVLRFHAVYWPAILLSAGLRLPNRILVHNYVTVDGTKIGKSLGNAINPDEPIRTLGLDAFRYYLLRHIGCFKDGDFTWQRYRDAYNQELVNQLGNLVARVTKLSGSEPLPTPDHPICPDLEETVTAHIESFALHKAMDQIFSAIEETNRYVSAEEPWKREGADKDLVLATAVDSLTRIGRSLAPFLPQTSTRITAALAGGKRHLFPRSRVDRVAL